MVGSESPESKRLRQLEREVEGAPRRAGARMRFGMALLSAGRVDEAASELLLAAKMEPATPQAALLACEALISADRAREAAHLLSNVVYPQRGTTVVTDEELHLLEAMLGHTDAYVRCHVARALGRLRVVRAVGALERAATDQNAAVSLAARASLRQLLAC